MPFDERADVKVEDAAHWFNDGLLVTIGVPEQSRVL